METLSDRPIEEQCLNFVSSGPADVGGSRDPNKDSYISKGPRKRKYGVLEDLNDQNIKYEISKSKSEAWSPDTDCPSATKAKLPEAKKAKYEISKSKREAWSPDMEPADCPSSIEANLAEAEKAKYEISNGKTEVELADSPSAKPPEKGYYSFAHHVHCHKYRSAWVPRKVVEPPKNPVNYYRPRDPRVPKFVARHVSNVETPSISLILERVRRTITRDCGRERVRRTITRDWRPRPSSPPSPVSCAYKRDVTYFASIYPKDPDPSDPDLYYSPSP